MKRKNITAILAAGMLSLYSTAYAQEGRVGINTTDPKTTLDVTGKTDTSGNLLTTDMTGLQAPRLTRAELTAKGNTLYGADQKGALVYITDISGGDATSQRINISAVGYYYFDGALWQAVANGASAAATEPWYNVATNAGATANTQDIYQMGKVGIGTTAPISKLTVYSPSAGSGATDAVRFRIADGINNPGVFISHIESTGLSTIDFSGSANYKGDISLGTIPAISIRNISDPFVGIGTTVPTNRLHVSANDPLRLEGLQSGAATDEVLTTDATGVVRKLTGAALASAVQEPWYNVATNAGATANTQDIYQMGRVGIGTNNPAREMEIFSTANNGAQIRLNGNTGTLGWSGIEGITSGGNTHFGVFEGNGRFFVDAGSNTTEDLVVLTNGNVGIGTITPNTKLAVVGLPVYADNGAATTAGLQAGDFYRTASGVVMVTY